jgi:hypothetical protein
MAPSSWGAHETELTEFGAASRIFVSGASMGVHEDVPDAVCNECSLIFAHPALAGCCSFHMITLPSYEHDARIWPNFGCAQATCHTGPVCLPDDDEFEKRKSNSESGLPFQCLAHAALGLAIYYVENLDGTVRGACRETLAVVIQLRIVLERDMVLELMIRGALFYACVRSYPHEQFLWVLGLREPKTKHMTLGLR